MGYLVLWYPVALHKWSLRSHSFLISVRLIFALSLCSPVKLLFSPLQKTWKQSSNCSDFPWISCSPPPKPPVWRSYFYMLFFLLSCCFILFDLRSFHFCLCVWLRRSCGILSASNWKSNVGQIRSSAVVFPTCASSQGSEALLLTKRCFWEREQNFWVTVLKPDKLLLAAPYQFTWESCYLLQATWFWWLQCLRSRI